MLKGDFLERVEFQREKEYIEDRLEDTISRLNRQEDKNKEQDRKIANLNDNFNAIDLKFDQVDETIRENKKKIRQVEEKSEEISSKMESIDVIVLSTQKIADTASK